MPWVKNPKVRAEFRLACVSTSQRTVRFQRDSPVLGRALPRMPKRKRRFIEERNIAVLRESAACTKRKDLCNLTTQRVGHAKQLRALRRTA